MSESRKNFRSFFHQIKFMIFKRVRLKNSLLSYSATPFSFTDIYRMVNFDWICLKLNTSRFWDNFDTFFSFLSQKTYPGEFLRPEVISSRSYQRKCSICLSSPHVINFSFYENAIKSELLGVRGYYFQDFRIAMIPTT